MHPYAAENRIFSKVELGGLVYTDFEKRRHHAELPEFTRTFIEAGSDRVNGSIK